MLKAAIQHKSTLVVYARCSKQIEADCWQEHVQRAVYKLRKHSVDSLNAAASWQCNAVFYREANAVNSCSATHSIARSTL